MSGRYFDITWAKMCLPRLGLGCPWENRFRVALIRSFIPCFAQHVNLSVKCPGGFAGKKEVRKIFDDDEKSAVGEVFR